MTPCAPGARRLGAGGALTVLQFAVFGLPGAGFKHAILECVQVQAHRGAFWRTRDSKLEGRKWQEAYLLHFLAD
jgi:hypothetical protein